MEQQRDELEARVDQLARELSKVQGRLEALETREGVVSGQPAARPEAAPHATVPGASEAGAPEPMISARTIALVGRTLVVLGGAYLLRAISEAALVPAAAGAGASLVYATGWLGQADRAAAKGQRTSAIFHGLAAAMVACPLIWETTTRFELLPPPLAAAALVVFLVLGLAVAWRRELWEVAWAVTLLALGTTLGLLVGTHAFLSFAIALLLMAVPVEWLAFRDRWPGLRWPVALTADLAVLMLITSALRQHAPPQGYIEVSAAGAIGVGLALPVLYLGSIAARTLVRERLVTPFEVVQAALVLLIGIGGAVRVIASRGSEPTVVGAAIVLLGAACYATAFASIDRRSGRGRNFYSYTTLAGLLVLVGSWMILAGAALAIAWSVLAVGAVVLGARFDRITLRFHGAIYIAAATTTAGLVACASDGLLADPAGSWRPVTPIGMALTVVAAACYGILVGTRRTEPSRWPDLLPHAIVGAVVVWCVAGMASGWLAETLTASGARADAAFVAAGRTAVLAILAVALAWAGRRWLLQELTWLVYPLLVGGGVKLLWEDFRHGEPVTLFIAFALYGGALIVTPRLMRREA